MDDVTNYMNNVGKDTKDQTFQLSVTYGELIILRALAQNPHPDYRNDPGVWETFKRTFNDIKFITDMIEDRASRIRNRSDNDLDF